MAWPVVLSSRPQGNLPISTYQVPLDHMLPVGKDIVERSRSNPPPPFDSQTIQHVRRELIQVQAALFETQKKYSQDSTPLKAELDDFLAHAHPPVSESRLEIPISVPTTAAPVPSQRPRKTSALPAAARSSGEANSGRRFPIGDRTPLPTVAKNPLDVWFRSAPLFEMMPSAREIEGLCAPIGFDSIPRPPPSGVHWRTKIANEMQEISPEIRKRLRKLPDAPPQAADVSAFWAQKKPPFPIEDLQRRNSSVLHRLVNAFVEAKPLPRQDVKNEDPLPVHVLLPQIECDEYLAFSFEERLEFELESAGLGRKKEQAESLPVSDIFAAQVAEYKRELEEKLPQIDALKEEICEEIEGWRDDQGRRNTEHRKAAALIQDAKKRGGHK
jgi:hypothetical protein